MKPDRHLRMMILSLCAFLLFVASFAQSNVTIEKVEVRGNHRIPQDTIFYYIMSRAGDVYDQDKLLQDFRALYKTNLFKDVKVDVADGDTGKIITFIVEEKPIIRSLDYEGIKSFKKSDILDKFSEEKLGLTIDSPFEPTKIKKAEKIIQNLLVLNGRPLGTVETVVTDIPPNAVSIVFKVTEGEKVRIGKIEFTGNKVFDSGKLKKTLKLDKERGLISMFKGTDKYHHDKLLYDIEENVKTLYQQYGYLDMKYGEPAVRIVEGPRGFIPLFRKTKKQFYITIPVEEGPQYRVNSVAFDGNTLFKSEHLTNVIGLKKGDIANFKQMKDGMDAIKKMYGMYGYIDFDISPSVKYDSKNLLVDITFNVDQGKQYRVNQIEFFGNTRTRDKVLRREFILVEQEVFSQTLLDISIQRLNQLGLFEKIEEKDYEIKRNSQDATVDLNVTVQEKGQQSIGFTGGVSGYQGAFVGLNYSTNNFLGYGDKLSVDAIFGTKIINFSLGLTDPYFMDTNTLLGFSVYKRRYRFDVNDYTYYQTSTGDATNLYTQNTTGFSITLGRPLGVFWRYSVSYELQNMSFPPEDINQDYLYLIQYQLFGVNPGLPLEEALKGLLRSEVTGRLSYNTTDDYFFPTRGKVFDVGVSFSGGILGGDFNLISPYAEAKWFIKDKWLSHGRNVLGFHGRAQFISPFGDTVAAPFFERYYMGGDYDLRGFDVRAISPWAVISTILTDNQGNPLIDFNTGLPLRRDYVQPIGGDLSLLGQTEYRIPIAGPVSLALFADVGYCTITQPNKLGFSDTTEVFLLSRSDHKVRSCTGVELQFMLPMINAPFRLIFSYNPNTYSDVFYTKDQIFPYDEPKTNVQFTIGKSF
jgi:outer membrane protein insertion porin family